MSLNKYVKSIYIKFNLLPRIHSKHNMFGLESFYREPSFESTNLKKKFKCID